MTPEEIEFSTIERFEYVLQPKFAGTFKIEFDADDNSISVIHGDECLLIPSSQLKLLAYALVSLEMQLFLLKVTQ